MIENDEERSGFRSAQSLLFDFIKKRLKEANTEDAREFWTTVASQTGLYPKLDMENWDHKTVTIWRKYDIDQKTIIGYEVYDLELIKPYVGDDPGAYLNYLYKNGYVIVYAFGQEFDEDGVPDCTVIKLINYIP